MTSEGGIPTVEQLVSHTRWMRGLATSLVTDRDLADDLVQETLIAAIGNPPRAGEPVRPWLMAIMRNRWRMLMRSEGRRARREATTLHEEMPSPEALLGMAQAQRFIAEAIEDMREPHRSVLLLRYYAGRKAAEIARHRGVPEASIRRQTKEALDLLRVRLDERHKGDRTQWKRLLLPLILPLLPPRRGLAASATAAALAGALVVGAGVLGVAQLRGRSAHRTAKATVTARELRPATAAPTTRAAAEAASTTAHGTCPPPYDDVLLGDESAGPRPRLVATRERLCAIRAALARPDSATTLIFRSLQARVDAARPDGFGVERLEHSRIHMAQSAALLYLVTGQARYAAQALAAVDALYDDPAAEALPHSGAPLDRATVGLGLAFVYDWTWNGLAPAERARLEARLLVSTAAWGQFDHPTLGEARASHWVAACRSAELVQLLALGAQDSEQARLRWLQAELALHLRSGYGSSGLGEEGLGLTAYQLRHLVPALLALRSLGATQLEPMLARRELWRVLPFAAGVEDSVAAGRQPTLPLGPIEPGVDHGAAASLLFPLVPVRALGAYRFIYDRHVGSRSALPDMRRYEPDRGGQLWALLLYPEETAPAEPLPIFGHALADDVAGVYVFRSGWQPGGDVAVALHADLRSHGGTIDRPHALALSLRAFGTVFAGGAGLRSVGRGASSLLVDGRAAPHRRARGARIAFSATPSGGYAVVGGGSTTHALGVAAAERHLAAEFPAGGEGVTLLSTLDRVQSSGRHVYGWRMVGEDGLQISAAQEGGRPSFTVRDIRGAWVKGWVLAPAGAIVRPGPPLVVEAQAANTNLWIALAVGTGAPPRGVARGESLSTELTIGTQTIAFDRVSERIIVQTR